MQLDSIQSLKRLSWQQVCTSICSYIDCALPCSNCSATTDQGLNEHHNKVQAALIALLMEPVTDKKHQEVLCRVFCPATKFDKPILNFDNPNLGCQTPACGKGLESSVLKPIRGEELEPFLEFLGMSLYNISLLLSSY